jgi:hypothetical protein
MAEEGISRDIAGDMVDVLPKALGCLWEAGKRFAYNTPQTLDQRLRWIRCLSTRIIQETNDGEQT